MAQEDRDRAFVCPHCEKAATARARGAVGWDGAAPSGELVDSPAEWLLVQCSNCGLPTLEVREPVYPGWEHDDGVVVYPAPRTLSPAIPHELAREWEEARRCFDARVYTACLVMVRRTVEGTCLDQGVKKKLSLQKMLEELKGRGLIDGELEGWADALRIAGNQGAHYTGEAVPREDADDALAFAEALLEHIYVRRKRFEAFKRRLNDKKNEEQE